MAFVPYMAGGFAVDKLMGGNGMTGMALGSGIGSMGGFGALGEAIGGSSALMSNTGASSLMAGNALGQGGMMTAGGMNALGMGGAASSGLSGFAPQLGSVVTPEYTPSLLMDSAYNAPIAPTDIYGGDLSMMQNQSLGNAQSLPIDYADPYVGGGYDASFGDTYLGNESMMANKNLGGIPGASQGVGGYGGGGLFGNAKDYVVDGFNNMSFTDKINTGLTANKIINPEPQQMIVPPAPPLDRRNPIPTVSSPLVTKVQGVQGIAPQNMMGQLSPEEQAQYYSLLSSI